MISKWIDETNMYKLTRAEAVAFVYFLLSEEKRHIVDIRDIRETVRHVRKRFEIEGWEYLELEGWKHKISEVKK